MHGNVVAVGDDVDDGLDVAQVERPWLDTLAELVQGERDNVDVARPLAITKETPFDPVSTSKQTHLGSSDGAASVIVRVQRDCNLLALGDVVAEVLDLLKWSQSHGDELQTLLGQNAER